MLFNSYIFIFLLLPAAIAGYYICNRIKRYELGKLWLITMSLWFYGYFNPSYLMIMLASIGINYILYSGMRKMGKHRLFLVIGLAFNIGLIFYFKYYDFFIENINALFQTNVMLKNILLPLGISFFTFQQISFIVDAYKGETGDYSLTDYALFVTFFPQLIAGPIVTHSEMIPQFQDENRKKPDLDLFAKGIVIFTIGLFKKVIVADTFGLAVEWGYANVNALDATNGILLMLFYAMQLYFDFSGYCDMAVGIGRLFGVIIPINFNSPYKSANMIEFWKRWHITLNRFMTNYVYIPLGGNRKGTVRTYFNLFMIFFVSGIWHGAGWTYIIWGCLSGGAYLLNRLCRKWVDRLPQLLTGFFTFTFFIISIVYFRAESVTQANQLLGNILQLNFGKINQALSKPFNLSEFWYVIKIFRLDRLPYSEHYLCIVFLVISLLAVLLCKNTMEIAESLKPRVWNSLLIAVMFVWCVASFAGVSTFLYFNF